MGNQVPTCDTICCESTKIVGSFKFTNSCGEIESHNVCRRCHGNFIVAMKIFRHDDVHEITELPEPYPKGQELFTILVPILVLIMIGFAFLNWMGWI